MFKRNSFLQTGNYEPNLNLHCLICLIDYTVFPTILLERMTLNAAISHYCPTSLKVKNKQNTPVSITVHLPK